MTKYIRFQNGVTYCSHTGSDYADTINVNISLMFSAGDILGLVLRQDKGYGAKSLSQN